MIPEILTFIFLAIAILIWVIRQIVAGYREKNNLCPSCATPLTEVDVAIIKLAEGEETLRINRMCPECVSNWKDENQLLKVFKIFGIIVLLFILALIAKWELFKK